MKEIIRKAQEFLDTAEGQEIAQSLAKHGLGICIPHMHDDVSGETVPLPTGTVSHEKNLQVTFVQSQDLDETNSIPVAWRWNGTHIEVCASCCGMNPPGRRSLKAGAK